jgi:hypothetical protein
VDPPDVDEELLQASRTMGNTPAALAIAKNLRRETPLRSRLPGLFMFGLRGGRVVADKHAWWLEWVAPRGDHE